MPRYQTIIEFWAKDDAQADEKMSIGLASMGQHGSLDRVIARADGVAAPDEMVVVLVQQIMPMAEARR